MVMNENEELRNRIAGSVTPESVELPDYLVAQAAKSKPKRFLGFNQLRLGLGSLAFGSLALVGAFVLPSAFAPVQKTASQLHAALHVPLHQQPCSAVVFQPCLS